MKAALLIDLADLWEIQAAMDKDPANTRRRETLRECADTVRMLAAMPAQAEPTMSDAIAAGDGTLHGAIDYWQQRALKAEQSEDGRDAEHARFYRWLKSRAVKHTAYDVYGDGCHWSIGFVSEDSSLDLDAAIAAKEQS